jgi:anti-anti-sigma regulatory factor
MKEKTDDKLTVRIASSIPKTLHSRDSAERLVRTVVSLWRARSDGREKNLNTLVLDFEGISQLSDSAAGALIEFRLEFSEDRNPAVEFSNMSDPVKKTFAALEKSFGQIHRRVNLQKKKKRSFLIEI